MECSASCRLSPHTCVVGSFLYLARHAVTEGLPGARFCGHGWVASTPLKEKPLNAISVTQVLRVPSLPVSLNSIERTGPRHKAAAICLEQGYPFGVRHP